MIIGESGGFMSVLLDSINVKLASMVFLAIEEVVCGGEDVLKVIKFVMQLLDVIFFVVPIGLMLMISVDFTKNVIAGKEDDMKKNLNLVIKRVIVCVALFLVDPIVDFTISLLGDAGVDYAECIKIAQTEDLSKYKINYPDIDYGGNEVNLGGGGSGYDVVDGGNGSSDSGTGTTGNSGDAGTRTDDGSSEVADGTKIIYIGDSRFQGMKNVVSYNEETEVWITKVGAGYDWFNDTALDSLKTVIDSDDEAIIVLNMGVNDPGNVDNYISRYNSVASSYKNSKVVAVSVNPINDSTSKSLINNSMVVEFNSELKKGLSDKIKYCDTYSKIKSSFGTTDGVHYTNSTSKEIYEAIKKCL